MFDYVDFEVVCPVCGKLVTGFQSKSCSCTMSTLKPWQVNNFYSSCNKCDSWLEYTRKDEYRIDPEQIHIQAAEAFKYLVALYNSFKTNKIIIIEDDDLRLKIKKFISSSYYPIDDSWINQFDLQIDKHILNKPVP